VAVAVKGLQRVFADSRTESIDEPSAPERQRMSATDPDFAVPFLPRIEFHIHRAKAAAVGGAAIAAGILIASPPTAGQSLQGTPLEVCAATVALAGATALVACGLFVLMRILLWRGPAVVIDGFGIHDRRTGPTMTPWSRVQDIRVLDRHGKHIGIDTAPVPAAPAGRAHCWPLSALRRHHAEPLTVIDTFFLRTATGNRVLDFVMPLTALTPIDLSDTPVSEQTLSADAALARQRLLALLGFIVAAGVIPAAAALLLAL
jgi:hypothetical protein